MIESRIDLYEEGEYNYEAAYGFLPNIHIYLHEDEQIRPCMLIVPGGGYCMVCGHEGEVVAGEFYDRGMNAVVLTYTSDITMSVPLKQQPLMDVSRAIRVVRKRHKEFHVNPNQIVICGFSAGGHVCASLCTHFEEIGDANEKYRDLSNRPDASVLCYPVITSGQYTHKPSMQALLGVNASKQELDYFSLENQVDSNTPPCFLWQTVEDDLVPVENSYLYAEALHKAGVPYAHYAFPVGGHGMSIANRALAEGRYPGDYTYEQLHRALEHVRNHTAIGVSEQRYRELEEQFFSNSEPEEESIDAKQKASVEEQSATEDRFAPENRVVPEDGFAPEDKVTSEDGFAPKDRVVPEDGFAPEDRVVPEDGIAGDYVPAVPDVSMWPELAWHFLKQVVLREDR